MANYKNGEVPASVLAPLDGQPGAFLRADAAAAWNRARKEIKAATGRDIRARGWNRTLAEQVKFFNLAYKPQASGGTDARWWNGRRYVRRPGKAAAAIPGTSNHGWGIAVDVEDFGLENQWNSAWRAKAFPILAKHGWTDHSGRSIGEPWHIEYDPNRDQHKNTPTPTPAPAPAPVPDVQEDDMRGLIEALYRRFLGREGSTQEIDNWTIDFAAAKKNAADVVATFNAGRAEVGTVVAAYREYLGREPGESEIASWLKNQPLVGQVRAGVANSPEAQKK